MREEVLLQIIESLRAGETPRLAEDVFTCFSAEATEGNPHIDPAIAQMIAKGLSSADIPTFERALAAVRAGELAWLGFKIVYDGDAALANTDNNVTKKYGEVGSANTQSGVFFCSDAKEVVSAWEYSPRDLFQMKDVTRGPSMHTEQFEGLTWCSVPLFGSVRVWLLGASDASAEVALLAEHVGFQVTVVDDDAAYLNESRFPLAERILLDSFDDLFSLEASPNDYVCVLTRGHVHDPEGCLWGTRHNAHYVGMMGCSGKNGAVYDVCAAQGMTDEQWESITRPIGLKFGAKTPAELAIAIVAELVDVRYRERYSQEARDKHDANLGR